MKALISTWSRRLLAALFLLSSCTSASSFMPTNSDDKIEIVVTNLSVSPPATDKYTITFAAKSDSSFRLDILVGKTEAGVLAIEMENMKPTAPLPLDLFKAAFDK